MDCFKYRECGSAGYFTINEFDKSGKVKTCFSTRIGGISEGSFSSLNLGYKSGDLKCNVDYNFNVLCKAAGFQIDDMVLSDQTHEDKYRIVNEKDRGKGTAINSDICGIDALITNTKNTALCIFTADCVPIFLFDADKNVIALCHAGWRGIIKEIVPKTIKAMETEYGSLPGNIMAAIGPSIGPCCFYVNQDVEMEFKDAFKDTGEIVIYEEGKIRVDLWKAVELQLKNAGLRCHNIINSQLCTSCNGDKFYSYRRDGSKTGRMASIIQLV